MATKMSNFLYFLITMTEVKISFLPTPVLDNLVTDNDAVSLKQVDKLNISLSF